MTLEFGKDAAGVDVFPEAVENLEGKVQKKNVTQKNVN